MVKELKITTKYKKDLKAYKHKPDILQELNKVIDILLSGGTLPEKYKNHTLGGNLKDINDCHVKPNDVLLYKINETEVTLVRFGPHNKLELTENNKKDVNIMKLYMREINKENEENEVMALLKGIPKEDIDHWQTDLYLRKTPEVTSKVINKLPDTYKKNVTTFRDNIDHDIWYEIPFVFPRQVNRKGVKESLDLDAERYLHVLIGQLQSELMKDNNFEYIDIDYDDKYVIIELILSGTNDNEYIARVPFTELHLGKFNKIEDDVQWILDSYTYINESVITEETVNLPKTLYMSVTGNNMNIPVTDEWPSGKKVWNIGNHNPYIKDGYVIVCNVREHSIVPETLEFVYVGADNAKALHKEAGRHTVNDKNYKKYLVADINLDESVITEDEIETWDVSFWDAEEQESYDTKTVRMTKDEVKKYVDKLNAKRTERDKENGSFYDYVLA